MGQTKVQRTFKILGADKYNLIKLTHYLKTNISPL